MSNADRTRTDKKPCPFDGSTDRDSNGQCHCRNVLYRLTHKPNLTEAMITNLTAKYNKALADGKTVVEARNAVSAKATLPAAKKTAAKKTTAKKTVPAAKKAAKKATPAPEPEPEPVADPLPASVDFEPVADEIQTKPTPVVVAEPVVDETAEHRAEWDADTDRWHCVCGYKGKGTGPSIRAHVSSEKKKKSA